ncbi:MAG: S8 family serine peptidase [Anaerolineae bacterium]|nr:S8 family serine peptidase [Anaerolineae bacterium]
MGMLRKGVWVGRLALVVALSLGALGGLTPAAAQEPHAVAILVVDDFGLTDLAAVDFGAFEAGESCAISLEGQAFAVRGATADPLTEQSHGDVVLGQLEEMIAEAGAEEIITLIPVDVHGVSTEVAAERIEAALAEVEADVVLLNMSFAVIPCEYLQAMVDFGGQLLAARDAGNLNRYRSLFQRAVLFYNDTVFPAMSRRSQQAQPNQPLDPLQAYLAEAGVVAVASAGNFGLNFPFWPGAWPGVVSVSASQGQGFYPAQSWDSKTDVPLLTIPGDRPNQRLRISNYGEVMMPGEYASAVAGATSQAVIAGTSFAAPRLSMAVALYLAEVGGDYCRDEEGFFALASGEWKNLTLPQAAEAYCPDMLAYLP